MKTSRVVRFAIAASSAPSASQRPAAISSNVEFEESTGSTLKSLGLNMSSFTPRENAYGGTTTEFAFKFTIPDEDNVDWTGFRRLRERQPRTVRNDTLYIVFGNEFCSTFHLCVKCLAVDGPSRKVAPP